MANIRIYGIIFGCVALLWLGGCAGGNATLGSANASFARGQYHQTIQQTQLVLAQHSGGSGEQAAAALYLQGRSFEQLQAGDEAEKQHYLASARRAYVDALSRHPSKALEGRIRTSVANVAYHQEDYTTALQQWQVAYQQTDLADQKPWILYRIGLSQQRLGQFEAADRSFAQVQELYANTEPARRAREKQGTRQFYVQVGVFSQPGSAQSTIDALKRMGHTPLQSRDGQGRTVISVGPRLNWAAARQLQAQVSPQYPDALIVP